MQIHYILGVLLVVYIAQAVLSLLQIQQIYRIIEQQKQTYQGKGYTLQLEIHVLLCVPYQKASSLFSSLIRDK